VIVLIASAAPTGRGFLFLGRCAILLAILAIAQAAWAADDNPQGERRHYEIGAQPLDNALARFSEISGVDVLLREASASQRRSPAVSGELTAIEALARLLEGSGLVARFTSARSAIVVPAERAGDPWIAPSGESGGGQALLSLDMMRVTAPRMIGAPRSNPAEGIFAQQLVVAIRRVVMERSVFAGGRTTDIRIATRIGSDGTLHDVRIVRESRDAAADLRLKELLEGLALGLLPPEGLRQPLIFDVSGR